jgi:Ala-tRNA(Pro) deacylase
MAGSTTTAGPYTGLVTWLQDHDVPFEIREHPLAYTATATAHAEGVDVRTFAKVVGVRTSDGGNALAVVDAVDQVDLGKLRDLLGVEWAALLSEPELNAILPDCEVGTIPPIPELAQVPVYADEAVRAEAQISFHAGSHRHSVRVDREAWERAAGIRYGEFAVPRRSVRSYAERGWT